MKYLSFTLTLIFYASSILSMEGPPSTPINIFAQRTGKIDTFCTTQATLVQNKTSLAQIAYTLRGKIGERELICAMGPIAYQNEVFLGRITSMSITETHDASLALLAFAIKDLKELHEKQDKTGIENHTLFIDAIVNPGSYESTIFDFFGFKKVSNLSEQDIYLLDPSSVGQERTNLCQQFLRSVFMISLEDKSDQNKEILPEIDARNEAAAKNTSGNLQKLLEEQGKLTRGDRPKKPTPSHLPMSRIDPSQLPTPIPAAAAPVKAAFPRLIRRVSEPKIRKSSRKKCQCKSGACSIHKKDLQ